MLEFKTSAGNTYAWIDDVIYSIIHYYVHHKETCNKTKHKIDVRKLKVFKKR